MDEPGVCPACGGPIDEAKKETEAEQATLRFDLWKSKVDIEFLRRTNCDWSDLCGETVPLIDAYKEGKSPEDFVTWYIEKYDLAENQD